MADVEAGMPGQRLCPLRAAAQTPPTQRHCRGCNGSWQYDSYAVVAGPRADQIERWSPCLTGQTWPGRSLHVKRLDEVIAAFIWSTQPRPFG
jgi:hypothetical protein